MAFGVMDIGACGCCGSLALPVPIPTTGLRLRYSNATFGSYDGVLDYRGQCYWDGNYVSAGGTGGPSSQYFAISIVPGCSVYWVDGGTPVYWDAPTNCGPQYHPVGGGGFEVPVGTTRMTLQGYTANPFSLVFVNPSGAGPTQSTWTISNIAQLTVLPAGGRTQGIGPTFGNLYFQAWSNSPSSITASALFGTINGVGTAVVFSGTPFLYNAPAGMVGTTDAITVRQVADGTSVTVPIAIGP